MKCPFCHVDNDRVIDSRAHQDGFAIRRRRECSGCKRRYTTYERLEELPLKVIKKDAVRELFKREKIYCGLAKACWKRPISDDQIQVIVAEVEQEIYDGSESEIESQVIGEILMKKLRKGAPVGKECGRRFFSVILALILSADFSVFSVSARPRVTIFPSCPPAAE